jgi:hypothetical protein
MQKRIHGTQLTRSPIGRRQAWTAFRMAASRRNGPPVPYQRRQRQLPQLQQDIRSSWRWFLPSAPRTNRTLSEMVPERCLTLALERPSAPRPRLHPPSIRSSAAKWARSIPRSSSTRRLGAPISPFVRAASRSEVGNESSGQDFRSMRPSLAVNYTAHVADSQRLLTAGPAVLQNQRSRR